MLINVIIYMISYIMEIMKLRKENQQIHKTIIHQRNKRNHTQPPKIDCMILDGIHHGFGLV